MAKINKRKKFKPKVTPVKQLTRKELRKEKQHKKKENKRQFFSKKNLKVKTTGKNNINPNQLSTKISKIKKPKTIEQLLSNNVDSDENESIASDFSDEEVDARIITKEKKSKTTPANLIAVPVKKVKTHVASSMDPSEIRRRDLDRQKDYENAARKQRIKQMKIENEEEDKAMAKLEKKLKLNKSKNKVRAVRKMFNDGLDWAMEFILDEDEKLQDDTPKDKRKKKQTEDELDSIGDYDDENGYDDGDDSDAEMQNFDEGDSVDNESHSDMDADDVNGNSNKDQYKEDIYGRRRDEDGNIIKEHPTTFNESSLGQKYIPPHQRAMLETQNNSKQTEILERLRRTCKGLLNRLSEANLHKIATSIEGLYMKNSRNNMNETLTALLNEALIGKTLSNERMVQEHMVLLAFLHAHIGTEIGAHFLQIFIVEFDELVKKAKDSENENKSLNNIVLVLSYMYIFKIFEHRLLIEIIARLAKNLCEKTIECMLLIFQSVGFKLRRDDPVAFKDMMQNVHQSISEAPLELKENLRLKFMVDILFAVKNNNTTKLPQYDPELAENLRKRLKAMLRNDKYVVTLNITIDDLLRADQVGKWWIVGSAWSGDLNDIGVASNKQTTSNDNQSQRFSEKLLALAKQQKMNTDERRNIFCIIMSAEDYLMAFEKILHLSLKDHRSIAYVIIHCCLNERLSNPYYSHLALKFCNYNRKFQLAFQFASWDRINDIKSLTKQQIRNLAKFLKYLILNGGLNLSIMKVVNFLELDKMNLFLMKEVTVGILLSDDEAAVYSCFERVAKNEHLNQFKNSLRLFIQHFLMNKEYPNLNLDEEQLELLIKRIDYVDKILAYIDL